MALSYYLARNPIICERPPRALDTTARTNRDKSLNAVPTVLSNLETVATV